MSVCWFSATQDVIGINIETIPTSGSKVSFIVHPWLRDLNYIAAHMLSVPVGAIVTQSVSSTGVNSCLAIHHLSGAVRIHSDIFAVLLVSQISILATKWWLNIFRHIRTVELITIAI